MIEFIPRLQQRYRSVQQADPSNNELFQSYTGALKTLVLAETLLLKEKLIASGQDIPLNLVIFGPTQAGKSTLVNALLPEPLAGVSPLAGYTVHPQGFAIGQRRTSTAWLETLLPKFKRYEQEHLHSANFESYSFSEIKAPSLFQNQQATVVWDTPDFDSVDAHGYIDGVLRTIGMADILILMVSKEKYADQSVWSMLELLAPIGLPLIVCINKLGEDEEQTLFRSFQNRFKVEISETSVPVLVSLPFVENEIKLKTDHVIQAIDLQINSLVGQPKSQHSKKLIELCWQDWIQPINDEIEGDLAWQSSLQESVNMAMQSYQSEFLEHPDYYDTFQRAMAELLDLLEVPGVGQSLGKARELITWPVRTLIGFGKSVITSEPDDVSLRDKNYEANLLRQLIDQMITDLASSNLSDQDSEGPSEEWKQAFRGVLGQSRPKITEGFEQKISLYQSDFEQEIQDAAKVLYIQLEDKPVLLNSLRAARVTTDAAAVVFALHSGGISLNDFILAPAMLSLSSMLAESSVGQYMNTVKARLKARQYDLVKDIFFEYLQHDLNKLRDQTMSDSRFSIPAAMIEEVESEFFGR